MSYIPIYIYIYTYICLAFALYAYKLALRRILRAARLSFLEFPSTVISLHLVSDWKNSSLS